jgi:hypothetical protein
MMINQVLFSLELGQDILRLAWGWRLGGPFFSGKWHLAYRLAVYIELRGVKGVRELWLKAPPTIVFGAPSYGQKRTPRLLSQHGDVNADSEA